MKIQVFLEMTLCCWGRWLPIYRRNVIPQSWTAWLLKMKALCSLEMWDPPAQHSATCHRTWIFDGHCWTRNRQAKLNTWSSPEGYVRLRSVRTAVTEVNVIQSRGTAANKAEPTIILPPHVVNVCLRNSIQAHDRRSVLKLGYGL
jgi:hypothetical protein